LSGSYQTKNRGRKNQKKRLGTEIVFISQKHREKEEDWSDLLRRKVIRDRGGKKSPGNNQRNV